MAGIEEKISRMEAAESNKKSKRKASPDKLSPKKDRGMGKRGVGLTQPYFMKITVTLIIIRG